MTEELDKRATLFISTLREYLKTVVGLRKEYLNTVTTITSQLLKEAALRDKKYLGILGGTFWDFHARVGDVQRKASQLIQHSQLPESRKDELAIRLGEFERELAFCEAVVLEFQYLAK